MEELCEFKYPITSLGIKPAPFRLVAHNTNFDIKEQLEIDL
jgi:hypothetical protein